MPCNDWSPRKLCCQAECLGLRSGFSERTERSWIWSTPFRASQRSSRSGFTRRFPARLQKIFMLKSIKNVLLMFPNCRYCEPLKLKGLLKKLIDWRQSMVRVVQSVVCITYMCIDILQRENVKYRQMWWPLSLFLLTNNRLWGGSHLSTSWPRPIKAKCRSCFIFTFWTGIDVPRPVANAHLFIKEGSLLLFKG